jgi:hypothetical protein
MGRRSPKPRRWMKTVRKRTRRGPKPGPPLRPRRGIPRFYYNGAVPRPLPPTFYARPTLDVARELLGCVVARRLPDGETLRARIVETEAYVGEEDKACHARAGRTPRTMPLYGPPGIAYIYLTYGMHHLLNAVTEREGFPAAVLIRAAEPLEGVDRMARARGTDRRSGSTCGRAKRRCGGRPSGSSRGRASPIGRSRGRPASVARRRSPPGTRCRGGCSSAAARSSPRAASRAPKLGVAKPRGIGNNRGSPRRPEAPSGDPPSSRQARPPWLDS